MRRRGARCQLNRPLNQVLIVGGGTAGWLTAAVLAAGHDSASATGLGVTLVESPDVATIGVGEGTWPSMRQTLRAIGVSELDFFRECGASFKQGSKFIGWCDGAEDDFYYHPFSLPAGYQQSNLVPFWQRRAAEISFAAAFSSQESICEAGLAPKQAATPEYAAVANYAYHLDAGKFADFLKRHCVEHLGVRHVLDNVTAINAAEDGDIESLGTRSSGELRADLFIDCSGARSILLRQHYGVGFVERRDILFNNRAAAAQVPYPAADYPIASATLSTAQDAGWVWDIGLPARRGVGYVFSSDHASEDEAVETLRRYLRASPATAPGADIEPRILRFEPGHLETFWHRNCVAVGMAAGFIEPLEASAIALIEMSAATIRDQLPANRAAMTQIAERYNRRFRYRWERVMDFLKLHYVLTRRESSDYWRDNCRADSIPDRLRELLALWRTQPPSHYDLEQTDEIFPSASYQYVYYGMGGRTESRPTSSLRDSPEAAERFMRENLDLTRRQQQGLPSNRELLELYLRRPGAQA